MSEEQLIHFPPLSFMKLSTSLLKSVRIYQFSIIESKKYQVYSLYFRYNSLLKLHNEALSSNVNNQLYPSEIDFPPKTHCPCKKPDRSNDFIDFLENITKKPIHDNTILSNSIDKNNNNDGIISNISMFLHVFDLNPNLTDDHLITFSSLFASPSIENPFGFEEPKVEQLISMPEHPIKEVYNTLSLKINGKQYQFYEQKFLGEGGYGTAKLYGLVNKNKENINFAVKFIRFPKYEKELRKTIMNSVLSEARILTEMNHMNVVKGYFYFKTRIESIEYFCNFMEFCNGGTLEKYLDDKRDSGEYIEEKEILHIFFEMLKGLAYARDLFRSKNKKGLLMHRDLKPDNIFFHWVGDHRYVKVGDFGLAKKYVKYFKTKGSLESYKDYQSPQMAKGKDSDKSDVWSLGVIVYYMYFYRFPWSIQGRSAGTLKVQKALLKYKKLSFKEVNRPGGISDDMKKLLKRMIVYNEDDRISLDDILKNSIYKKEWKADIKQNKKNKKENIKVMSKSLDININKKDTDQKMESEVKNRIDEKFSAFLDILIEGSTKTNKIERISESKEGYNEKYSQKLDLIPFEKELKLVKDELNILNKENKSQEEEEKKEDIYIKRQDSLEEKLIRTSRNKAVFLGCLASSIEKFFNMDINIEKVDLLRFYIYKLRIAIILKTLNETITYNEDARSTLLKLLNDSVVKFKNLQVIILNEITTSIDNQKKFNGKHYNVDETIGFLNPYIRNFDKFFEDLAEIFIKPIMKSLKEYIEKNMVFANFDKEDERKSYIEIISLYKNLHIFSNLQKIFEDLNKDLSEEILMSLAMKEDYKNLLQKFGFLIV